MAFLAGAALGPRGELPFMIIAMAIEAFFEFQALERFAGSVTFLTGHCGMRAVQCEMCLGVIELPFGDIAPTAGVMAALAILAEFIVVGVFVAIETFSRWNSGQLQIIFIFLRAIINN